MGTLLVALLQLGVPSIISTTFLGTAVTVFWDVELDGRPETQEWVVNATSPGPLEGMVRTVQLRPNGTLCIGPWFDPRPEPIRGLNLVGRLEKLRGLTHVTGEGPGLTFAVPLLPPAVCS